MDVEPSRRTQSPFVGILLFADVRILAMTSVLGRGEPKPSSPAPRPPMPAPDPAPPLPLPPLPKPPPEPDPPPKPDPRPNDPPADEFGRGVGRPCGGG